MIGTAVKILLPRPVVFERHELIEVSTAIDHRLFVDRYARRAHLQLFFSRRRIHIRNGCLCCLHGCRSGLRRGRIGGCCRGSGGCLSNLLRGRGGRHYCRLRSSHCAAFFLIVVVPVQHHLFSYTAYSSPLLTGFTVGIVQRAGLWHWRWLRGCCGGRDSIEIACIDR